MTIQKLTLDQIKSKSQFNSLFNDLCKEINWDYAGDTPFTSWRFNFRIEESLRTLLLNLDFDGSIIDLEEFYNELPDEVNSSKNELTILNAVFPICKDIYGPIKHAIFIELSNGATGTIYLCDFPDKLKSMVDMKNTWLNERHLIKDLEAIGEISFTLNKLLIDPFDDDGFPTACLTLTPKELNEMLEYIKRKPIWDEEEDQPKELLISLESLQFIPLCKKKTFLNAKKNVLILEYNLLLKEIQTNFKENHDSINKVEIVTSLEFLQELVLKIKSCSNEKELKLIAKQNNSLVVSIDDPLMNLITSEERKTILDGTRVQWLIRGLI